MPSTTYETTIRGFTDIPFIPIRKLLTLHLKQLSIDLVYTKSIANMVEPCQFCVIDGHSYLSLRQSQQNILQEKFETGVSAYALLLKRDYKSRLALLNASFQDCFEFPIMTEILSRTIKNQLAVRYRAQPKTTTAALHESENAYAGQYNNSCFDFLISHNSHWYLRHKKLACYISPIEKRIFEYLARNKRIIPKRELAFIGWHTFEVKDNTVVATIKRLRYLCRTLRLPFTFRNLYGYGYSLATGDNS